jgi:hypothetical protein
VCEGSLQADMLTALSLQSDPHLMRCSYIRSRLQGLAHFAAVCAAQFAAGAQWLLGACQLLAPCYKAVPGAEEQAQIRWRDNKGQSLSHAVSCAVLTKKP